MKNAIKHSGLAARILITGAIAVTTILPMAVVAQRGRPSGGSGSDSGGSRGSGSSGGGSSRGSDPSPRRESSPPPQRSERSERGSEPSRRESPPARREESSRPSYDPPARRGGEDRTPERRQDPSPRRDSDSERRPSDSGSERTGGSLPQRDNPAPRRDSDRSDSGRTRNPDSDRLGGRRDNVDDPGTNPFNRRNPSGSSDRSDSRDSIGQGRTRTPDSRSGDTLRYRGGLDNRGHDVFTRSMEGRRFNNGIVLREGGYITNPRIRTYFSTGFCYFPYYYHTYNPSLVYWSPYSYYYGSCPPYFYRHRAFYRPPSLIYIEVPVYVGNDCRGYDSDLNDYYLNRSQYDLDTRDRELRQATDALREAFRYSSIEPLADITDPGVRISIFRRGKYEYTIEANDFLDMTRDAMRATDTISFDLYRFKQRSSGVVVVSGKHVYRNGDGERRTVYVSYVLERLNGRWILTQVGTAPDRIEEPRN